MLMNINQMAICLTAGRSDGSALMVIGVSTWYPDTCCNRICLNFLYSQVVGTLKHPPVPTRNRAAFHNLIFSNFAILTFKAQLVTGCARNRKVKRLKFHTNSTSDRIRTTTLGISLGCWWLTENWGEAVNEFRATKSTRCNGLLGVTELVTSVVKCTWFLISHNEDLRNSGLVGNNQKG